MDVIKEIYKGIYYCQSKVSLIFVFTRERICRWSIKIGYLLLQNHLPSGQNRAKSPKKQSVGVYFRQHSTVFW